MMNSFLMFNPEALTHRAYYDIFRVVHHTRVNGKVGFNFDSRIIPNLKALYDGKDREIISLIRSLDESGIKAELSTPDKV